MIYMDAVANKDELSIARGVLAGKSYLELQENAKPYLRTVPTNKEVFFRGF